MKTSLKVVRTAPGAEHSLASILTPFFDMYTLNECQNEIWNLVQAYSSIPERELPDPQGKGNTIFFCRNIDKLIRQLHDFTERNES